VHICSQLLFVEDEPDRLRLDGALMQEPMAGVPSGSPVSLLLRKPSSEAVAAVVEATVQRWVSQLDVVDIELLGEGGRPRASLSDGTSTIRLDVDPSSFV
jgi:hypothetical protein